MDHDYDSNEEFFFSCWIREATEKGLIDSAEYHPASFPLTEKRSLQYSVETKLKTKTRIDHKNLIVARPMVYTPDWKIKFNRFFLMKMTALGVACDIINGWCLHGEPIIYLTNGVWYVDVKGEANRNDDGRHFTAMQKMTLALHDTYVQRVVVS